jgi:uncharacterized delta-60 repeat protein
MVRMPLLRRFASVLVILAAGSAHAGFGDRDCSFGVAGVHTLDGSFGAAFNFAPENGGNVWFRAGHLSTSASLYRMNPSGTLSTRVWDGLGTGVTDPTLIQLSNGRILVLSREGVRGYGSLGQLDSSFGVGGLAAISGFEAFTSPLVLTDGRILAGGRRGGAATLVRFNSDGSVDPTFGSGGAASDPGAGNALVSMTLQADGRILGASQAIVSRYEASGVLDTGFGSGGRADLTGQLTVAQVRLQPSGKILVAGTLHTGGNEHRIRLARLEANGAMDVTIGGGAGYREVQVASVALKGGYTPWFPLVVLPDGRPLIVGTQTPTGTTGAIVRYGVDLADDAVVLLDFVPSAAFPLASGRLLVGTFHPAGTVRRLLGDTDLPNCVTTTTSLSSSPNPSAFSQSVTLTATVTPAFGTASPTGSVQFMDGSNSLGQPVSLVSGVASAAISNLTEGAHSLTAVYQGADGFLGSTSSAVTHNVTFRPATTTTLSTSPNPSNSGQAVTMTATVAPASGPGTPTGQVQFKDGTSNLGASATLSGGVATLVTSSLGDGSHSITSVYAGDTNFGPSTSPAVTHVVPGRLTVNDPTANAANGATTMIFTVTLTAAAAVPVTVSYATTDRTARAGADYTATSGSLTFNPGETSKSLTITIAGQSVPGSNKDFFVTLTNPTNASLAKGAGIGTITYASSGTLSIYIDDPTVAEGYSGITLLGFTVTLSRAPVGPLSVDYATADGTAAAGSDYTAKSGSLTFETAQTQRWVVVPINANSTPGSNRTFFVNLSNAVGSAGANGATIVKAQGTGSIVDDDPTPAAASVAQYRLYSEVTKEHLYTADANEYAVLGTRGWTQEGVAYTMFRDGGSRDGQYAIPLYRMYHRGILQHHWTPDTNEILTLAAGTGWNYEGIAGHVLPAAGLGTTPLYRLRLNAPPLHIWTTDLNEKTVLSTERGWVYEGVVGHVIP